MKKILLFSLLLLLSLPPVVHARAQEEIPDGPIYVVEEGDTLSSIALSFGVTVDNLVSFNGLPDANSLFVGDQIAIPGLPGVTGRLETASVPFGENMRSLSRIYQIPPVLFAKLNRLVSPAELHRGASVVLTRGGSLSEPYRISMPAGQSYLETAARSGSNPWAVVEWNGAGSLIRAVPGDVVFVSSAGDTGPMAMPRGITGISLNSLYQGEAASLRITSDQLLTMSGTLGPYNFKLIRAADTAFVSLQGIHALLEPGMYPLRLSGTMEDGTPIDFIQSVKIFPRDYIFEYINVPPELVDPETTEAETAFIMPFVAPATPEKLWNGVFQPPSPFESCINSTFGNRRSYNGSAFSFYHSGVDYCGGTGVEIFAPARGMVVYTGLLDVRGNFTVIDHGWGVYTAYLHQSEVFVSVGERVKPGDVIGLVGNTGRSTGPHLHWEVWVNGVPVNPLDWLVEEYP